MLKEALAYIGNPYLPETVDLIKEGITVIDGLIYSRTEDGFLRMDCHLDETVEIAKRPAVVWIHGGGFTEERLTRKSRPEKRFLEMLRRGYLIASIDYRISQVRPFPSQIQDTKCAVRFLRANAGKLGIDPDRIGVWGESCGGQLAGLMAVKGGIDGFENVGGWENVPSDVAAAVSWYGALDVMAFHRERMEVDAEYPPRFEIMYGGKPEEMESMLLKASPLTYADRKIAPLLAMCSDGDNRISYTVNLEFCERSRNAGNYAEFVKVPNQEHGYFSGEKYDSLIFDFFDRFLIE